MGDLETFTTTRGDSLSHLVDRQDEEGEKRKQLACSPLVKQEEAHNAPFKKVVKSREQL